MRQAFAHEALVTMAADGDPQAIGAAVTVQLCGHWEHEPPCPLAAHHSRAERIGAAGDTGDVGTQVRVRVLFATEPTLESTVRERIDAALRSGERCGPDGVTSRWQVLDSRSSPVAAAETDHAERLTR